ncbi:Anaerobic glycerol-3-phosphate dehydrogenase subunit C [Pirellulimonas nuda]|uniref:Anaerobic glycerol-3-phosphate dehydrogenase subunit C n=1 Tax=Pirellulimonas nuda TaxID=2528009 RepID=A0A518DF97_9BACT|nr:FAD-binding and (Fe-S)-binding domain-containing protein [Pirellulimonas nuda]QDU90136.1 Anaerobic glycerol-3-phosphate dehydrogenase subunit C [Pirellulimonas nuda]
MESDRKRIEEDLRGLIEGEVRCDGPYLRLFATDGSIYDETPVAVVAPRLRADIVAVVRYAAENRIPVHARGAGSGLAGGAVGPGIVIDFARHMHRITQVSDDSVRVLPGCTLADLNRRLRPQKRLFGPDPANAEVTTLGGSIAVNSSGSRFAAYGAVGDHLRSATVVLADGETVTLERRPAPDDRPTAEGGAPPDRSARLAREVHALWKRRRSLLEERRPKTLVDSSGYALCKANSDSHVDLARLMAGSEGTLGLLVEAELATQTPPAASGVALLLFDSLDRAAQAVECVAPLGPSACDLMDRRHISLARDMDVRYELMIPGAAESVLLVEFFGADQDEVDDRLHRAIDTAQRESALAAGSLIAADDLDRELFWRLSKQYAPTLQRARGVRRPMPGIEDIAVPPAGLTVFLRHVQDTLRRRQITASVFGHAAHGQLHIRPFLDLHKHEDVTAFEGLAEELYDKAWLLGGTMSGEHGDGRSRTPFAVRQHGPVASVFRELKMLFDPEGVLNPGKVVPASGGRFDRPLRFAPLPVIGQPDGRAADDLQAGWSIAEAAAAADACNGCGTCRSRADDLRMCPIFRFTPREEASPRAKANLVRSALSGQLPPTALSEDASREVADLCVHCHMCRQECPAGVDVPRLAVEIKANHLLAHGVRPAQWWMANIVRVSRWGSRFPRVANWALGNRAARWLLDKGFDLSQAHRLPTVHGRTYLSRASQRGAEPATPRGRAFYFVDTYANHYDPELGEAFTAVLQHCGVAVECPADQDQSAMPLIAQGHLEPARKIAQRNVERLAEAVRRGATIVATEPSAVLALTHEYLWLLPDEPDARLVAEHAREACHYLWGLHQRGVLRLDLGPVRGRVAYHVPCHLRALGIGAPAENLLGLVPELRLTRLDKGCSGMAGLYGLRRKNYRSSLRAGLPMLTSLRDGPFDFATTECSTCQLQMTGASPRATIHPIKLLAASYGLAPRVAEQVAAAVGDET